MKLFVDSVIVVFPVLSVKWKIMFFLFSFVDKNMDWLLPLRTIFIESITFSDKKKWKVEIEICGQVKIVEALRRS